MNKQPEAKELTTVTTIQQLSNRIQNGELSPSELVGVCLDKIKKFDSPLNAFITVLEDHARQEAAKLKNKLNKESISVPCMVFHFQLKMSSMQKELDVLQDQK